MPEVRSLYASLGFKLDEGSVKKAEHAFTEMNQALELVAKVCEVVKDVITDVVKETVGYAAEMTRMSKMTGVGVDELQRLAFAAEESGVEIGTLQRAMMMMERHGFREPGKALMDMAGRMEKMPNAAQRTQYAMQMLGRSGYQMLPMLMKGRKGLEDLVKEGEEAGVFMGKDAVADAMEARKAMKAWHVVILGLERTIAGPFVKAVGQALAGIVEWIKLHHEFIRFAMDRAVGLVVDAFKALYYVGRDLVYAWRAVADLVGGPLAVGLLVIGALVTGLVSPWMLIGAAILLVLDDIRAFSTGGRSLIGAVRDAVEKLWSTIGQDPGWRNNHPVKAFFLDLLQVVTHIDEVWDGFIGSVQGAGKWMGFTWKTKADKKILSDEIAANKMQRTKTADVDAAAAKVGLLPAQGESFYGEKARFQSEYEEAVRRDQLNPNNAEGGSSSVNMAPVFNLNFQTGGTDDIVSTIKQTVHDCVGDMCRTANASLVAK